VPFCFLLKSQFGQIASNASLRAVAFALAAIADESDNPAARNEPLIARGGETQGLHH
jgi:hypothetical protein